MCCEIKYLTAHITSSKPLYELLSYEVQNGYTHAGVRIVSDFLQYAGQPAACATVICHIADVPHTAMVKLGGLVDRVMAWQTKKTNQRGFEPSLVQSLPDS